MIDISKKRYCTMTTLQILHTRIPSYMHTHTHAHTHTHRVQKGKPVAAVYTVTHTQTSWDTMHQADTPESVQGKSPPSCSNGNLAIAGEANTKLYMSHLMHCHP